MKDEIFYQKYNELMNRKFKLEDSIISLYQEIQAKKRDRLKKIRKLGSTETELRILFKQKKVRRMEIK